MLTQQSAFIKKLGFSTKAGTLASLSGIIQSANILPLYYFTVQDWQQNQKTVLKAIAENAWHKQTLVVRSSALSEDSSTSSAAGLYTSVLNVKNEKELIKAIDTVTASYEGKNPQDQILVQPQLADVIVSGVAFTKDPSTKSSYYVINYDDATGSTDSVTSGTGQSIKCFIRHKSSPVLAKETWLNKVISLMAELEAFFDSDQIDIEFAVTSKDTLYLLQARPLIIEEAPTSLQQGEIIERIANKIALGIKRHPYLYGERTVYGVMPDWNPAEIIGVRPRPLALSLYREVITDAVWAYQRDNYGYNGLRSFPLLVDFEGLPYIDVRVSFNSFLPKNIPAELAERLVCYYINRLIEAPALHDKVEFEIIFSCYTLDLQERLSILSNFGFSKEEQTTLFNELTQLTNRIIHNKEGLWKKDLEKIYELQRRQELIFNSELDPIAKMYWIIEDCKRFGTLPFAGLARAGFIAVQLLKSFVAKQIISQQDYANFFASLDAISSKIYVDFNEKSREEFLKIYGHLRPGTYDINSLRYDEAPDDYFNWSKVHSTHEKENFSLNIHQLRTIQQHIDSDNLQTNVLDLLEFIKIAIESREYSKFVFTRSLSEYLKLAAEYANKHGFTRDDCSYLDVSIFRKLYSTNSDPTELIGHNITLGKKQYAVSKSIVLPPLLCHPEDAWQFTYPEAMPNFITQQSCEGHVATTNDSKENMANSILFIPSADPGYDWIFSQDIAGFVTLYGGANSHMAIRAGELGIPAIIGAGETNYLRWSKAKRLKIDAANKQVYEL